VVQHLNLQDSGAFYELNAYPLHSETDPHWDDCVMWTEWLCDLTWLSRGPSQRRPGLNASIGTHSFRPFLLLTAAMPLRTADRSGASIVVR
jgi:hypothetical protein